MDETKLQELFASIRQELMKLNRRLDAQQLDIQSIRKRQHDLESQLLGLGTMRRKP
jgi:hypothetical protein